MTDESGRSYLTSTERNCRLPLDGTDGQPSRDRSGQPRRPTSGHEPEGPDQHAFIIDLQVPSSIPATIAAMTSPKHCKALGSTWFMMRLRTLAR